MLIISASGFFDARRSINQYGELIARVDTVVPEAYVTLFKKNAIPVTPMRSGGLRRSIVTRYSKGKAEIGWRASYAVAQNRGMHTQQNYVRGWNQRDGGYSTIKPGKYIYTKYTTPGTGKQFFAIAKEKTDSEFPAKLRELGYGQ